MRKYGQCAKNGNDVFVKVSKVCIHQTDSGNKYFFFLDIWRTIAHGPESDNMEAQLSFLFYPCCDPGFHAQVARSWQTLAAPQ